ncbi:MAG: YjbE family putative metal transport protein [Proteobacteria bacterium]|nr:YjbE family putative metal transport protein [Pseudomonadota bacterium]
MDTLLAGIDQYTQPHFWVAVVQIIWINVLLSGDNAIVIALACRNLPPKQRLGGIILGTLVALAMRLVFASVVSSLMLFPYIKIVGGLALLWIAVKLLLPEDSNEHGTEASDSLWRAVQMIAVADIVMSLDNVIAVAAAANGNTALLVFGLGISIPAIVAGATIIMAMLNHFPFLLWAGAGLLGWVAGDVIGSDPVIGDQAEVLGGEGVLEKIRLVLGAAGAVGTVLVGYWLRSRRREEEEEPA